MAAMAIRTAFLLVLLSCVGLPWSWSNEEPAAAPNRAGDDRQVYPVMLTDQDADHINVNIRYSGSRINFIGTAPEGGCAIVSKLTSTHNPAIKLMRKGKVVLFWMGVKQVEVSGLPFMFKVNCSTTLDRIPRELTERLGLSLDVLKANMELEILKGTPSDDDADVVFEGFSRLKENEGLYQVNDNAIKLAGGQLFSHAFFFPPKAIEGEYRIETYAIKDGRVLARGIDTVTVRKVGLVGGLSGLARKRGLIYGIMAVVVALAVGLSIGLVFKKGGH